MAFQVTVYPSDQGDPIDFIASALSFVNNESFGDPYRLTKVRGRDIAFVNIDNAVLIEVTGDEGED